MWQTDGRTIAYTRYSMLSRVITDNVDKSVKQVAQNKCPTMRLNGIEQRYL